MFSVKTRLLVGFLPYFKSYNEEEQCNKKPPQKE
jgi:hypothetical protein